MAEFLYATSHLAGDFTNPDNANGDTSGTWAGELNNNQSQTSRWAVGNPADPLTGSATQTIRVVARKGSNSKNPSITVNLYESGTLVSEIVADTSITSTSGQTLTGTWTSEDVSNADDVEVEVVMTAQGGSPSSRNSAQISHIEWEADTSAAAKTATGSSSLAVTTTGTPQRTAKGTASSSLTVTTTGTPQRTAKGTGASTLAVSASGAGSVPSTTKTATGSSSLTISTTATPQRIAKGTGSSSLTVTTTGTPARTAKGTGSSSLTVTTTGTPARTAKGTGSSSLTVTTAGTPQRTAKGAGASNLAFTTSSDATPTRKGTGSSSLAITVSAAGGVAGTALQATGSSVLEFNVGAVGFRHSGPKEGPFVTVRYFRNTNNGTLVRVPTGRRIRRGGWKSAEGWEEITEAFKIPVDHYMESRVEDRFRATWEANSGADASTLKTMIESDCTDAGYDYA